MSQYFDVGDETLWNPSNGAARLFLRHVTLYEDELGVPSGIGPMENDECRIDPAALGTFVNTLLQWRDRTRHHVVDALSAGFLATAVALAERAGADVRWPEHRVGLEERTDLQAPLFPDRDWTGPARERVGELLRAMPR